MKYTRFFSVDPAACLHALAADNCRVQMFLVRYDSETDGASDVHVRHTKEAIFRKLRDADRLLPIEHRQYVDYLNPNHIVYEHSVRGWPALERIDIPPQS